MVTPGAPEPTPEAVSPARTRARRAREWAAVAVSLALGLVPPLLVATGKHDLPRNDISREEQAFEGIGHTVPEARVGWVLPGDPPPGIGKIMLIAQYALLPRRLTIVTVPRCKQAGRAACGVDDLDVAAIPHFADYDGVPGATELGFAVEGSRNRYVVVGIRRR